MDNNIKGINIGELYSKYPKPLNAFYDWLDNKYEIKDYIDRFKQYLYNDIMFKHYMFEFLDQHGYYIYIKPIMSSESMMEDTDNDIVYKFCINNIPYDTYNFRFDCEINAITKSLTLLEKLL